MLQEIGKLEPKPTIYRLNILTGEQLVVQSGRASRPWSGDVAFPEDQPFPKHVDGCFFCPGEKRVNGSTVPNYDVPFVFRNDNPAIIPVRADKKIGATMFELGLKKGPFIKEAVFHGGDSEMVLYGPDHGKMMLHMNQVEIASVVKAWQQQYSRLGKIKGNKYILIFENRGKEKGNSQPHPHGQTYAYPFIPNTFPFPVKKELETQKKYFNEHKARFFADMIKDRDVRQEGFIAENKNFVWLMPPWAVWPTESMIIPKKHLVSIDKMTLEQVKDMANMLQIATKTYGVAFIRPVNGAPYSLGIHQAPTDGKVYDFQDLWIGFTPPLRDPFKVKFMVGAEEFGMRGRDSDVRDWANFLRGIAQRITSVDVENADLQAITDFYYQKEIKDEKMAIIKNPNVVYPF